MDLLRDLSFQVAIIIFPLFLYESLWISRHYRREVVQNKVLLTLLSISSVILCMLLPVKLSSTISFDLAAIPLVVAFLYGGWSVGVYPLLGYGFYNFYVENSYQILNFFTVTLVCLCIAYFATHWERVSKRQKGVYMSLIGFLYSSTYFLSAISLFGWGGLQRGDIYGLTWRIALIGIAVIIIMVFYVYLKENMMENAMIRFEMQRTEKLNIVSELAASVAHEVRNPLTVVRGFIQLIENDAETKNREYLKLVLDELDRAESIISDYLNLARPQIEEKKEIYFTAQLKEACTIMSSFATLQGVYLQTCIDDELYVYGDKTRIKQAIMNVLKNGVEAVEKNKGYLKITAFVEGDSVVVKIKDNGIGMTQEQLDRLGEPYYSLKEKGTGLGLMVTFSIIEAHEGRIQYFSEEGKGTETVIRLPLHQHIKKVKEMELA